MSFFKNFEREFQVHNKIILPANAHMYCNNCRLQLHVLVTQSNHYQAVYQMCKEKLFYMYWFLVINQRDAQILFYVFIFLYNSLHVSSTSCLSPGEKNCINTASGNSHSMLVDALCAGCKKSSSDLHTTRHHQHRMTVTRGCIDTICLSWWWALCVRNV
jgi:hypothetical protein